MKIKILYEDKDILAIEKPSGILVHSDGREPPESPLSGGHPPALTREGRGWFKKTIQDIFRKKYPKLEIVHRLDKETSGVMLLAKNKKAHEFLKKQFMGREVKKIYVAIVSGFVKNDRGVINMPIGRSPRDFRRWLSGRGARGEMRDAITEYRVIKRLHLPINTDKKPINSDIGVDQKPSSDISSFTLLEVKPKTGRTHQIRVHMKFLNHPVVCDSLYNPLSPCPKGLSRLALHAKSIEFTNLQGKTIKVESPLPAEFKRVVK